MLLISYFYRGYENNGLGARIHTPNGIATYVDEESNKLDKVYFKNTLKELVKHLLSQVDAISIDNYEIVSTFSILKNGKFTSKRNVIIPFTKIQSW
jgi:hypothetical protein